MLFTRGNPNDTTWGGGPVITLPTASDDAVGSGKWAGGVAGVWVATPGRWMLAALGSNIWSLDGQSDKLNVNLFSLQYFISYNFTQGWYLTTSPIITANWNADPGERWTIPVGGGGGKVFLWGKQPMNFQVQAFYNVERPDNAPEWSLRAQLMFLFPW